MLRLFSSLPVINRASARREVFAVLGVNRRVDSIMWGLRPFAWMIRFLLAVDHITGLVDGIAFLLEQFGLLDFMSGTPLLRAL